MKSIYARPLVAAVAIAAPLMVFGAGPAAAAPPIQLTLNLPTASADGTQIDVQFFFEGYGYPGGGTCVATATPVNPGSELATSAPVDIPSLSSNDIDFARTVISPKTSNTYTVNATCTIGAETFAVATPSVSGQPLVTLTGLPAPTPKPTGGSFSAAASCDVQGGCPASRR